VRGCKVMGCDVYFKVEYASPSRLFVNRQSISAVFASTNAVHVTVLGPELKGSPVPLTFGRLLLRDTAVV
jgi:hypothetical protein